jgi:cytochrome c oxidase subunit II
MTSGKKRGLASTCMGVLLLMLSGSAFATSYGLNMPVGVTDISARVYGLHMLIFWICVIIGVVVFGVMFYSILKHRKSLGAKPATFHENTTIEVVWTVIPFLILVGMAIPATRVLIAMEDTSDSDLTIKSTAYQWKWHYEYINEDVGFFSNLATPRTEILGMEEKGEHYLLDVDNPVVVPVDKKVRLLLTSNDVIHAWWVPELAVKKDAIPGFINELWFQVNEPGVYRGQCAELCGRDHGFMPIVVVAKEQDAWEAWLREQQDHNAAEEALASAELAMEDLMSRGQRVHDAQCASCHQVNGEGIPNVFPAISGSEIATGDLEAHMEIVMRGRSGTAMPAFGPQLNDVDLAAVITYQRNAWGNDTGDQIQPPQIGALR